MRDPHRNAGWRPEAAVRADERERELCASALLIAPSRPATSAQGTADLPAHCREHRREAQPTVGFHAWRAVSARQQTRTHRPRRCRPRPGNRQKHHPSTRRNPHPHPPGRWGALRHGATTRRTTAHCQMTIRSPWRPPGGDRRAPPAGPRNGGATTAAAAELSRSRTRPSRPAAVARVAVRTGARRSRWSRARGCAACRG